MKKLTPLLLCGLLSSCSTYWEADSSTNQSGVRANVVYTRQQYTLKERLRVYVTDKSGEKIATHEIKGNGDYSVSFPRFEVDEHFKGDILRVKLLDPQERVIRTIKVDIYKGEM